MKKILFSATIVSVLISCSGEEKKDEKKDENKGTITVCECVNGFKDLKEKLMGANGDEKQLKAMEKEWKELQEKCDKLEEGLSDEEKEKLSEEAKNC